MCLGDNFILKTVPVSVTHALVLNPGYIFANST